MTIQKIAVIAGVVLLACGWCIGATAQMQRQPPSAAHNYGMAGTPSQPQQERRAPGNNRPPPPAYSAYRPGTNRPPAVTAPRPPLRYRQPAIIVTPSILIGSVLPYGYGYNYYPTDNWSYYNLPAPCCGQYWVQYGQSFLLVSPDGVVLQVFTP